MSSLVLAQETPPSPAPNPPTVQTSTPNSNADKNSNSSILDNRTLNSHLGGQIIKRLGEPGFYFSKFLNFRRQLTQPTCTLSEQINKVSVITAMVGEVTSHAFYYFRTKSLQKKFSSRIKDINNYRDGLVKDNKKILEYDNKAPDVQLESLKFMRESAKVDLKHAEIVRGFTYSVLGMQITSKIIASNEVAAEAGSLGSTAAATNACKTAKQEEQVQQEAKVQAMLDGKAPTRGETNLQKAAREEVPWYLEPLKYLAKGLSVIEDSDLYQGIKSYKGSQSTAQQIEAGNASATGIKDAKTFMEVSQSAAYAEDMMVDIVTDVIKKVRSKRQSARDDINGLNKKEQDSTLMKIIKTIGVEDIAIRMGVRAIIKANLIQVNTFMRSAAGRVATFIYNVYVTHRTIADTEAGIKYHKEKIALLDKAIDEFESKKTVMNYIKSLPLVFLPATAMASIDVDLPAPIPPCVREITPSCSLKNINFVSQNAMGVFNTLPPGMQKQQLQYLKSNYSVETGYRLATGSMSYDQIDIERTKKEIEILEKIDAQYEKSPKRADHAATIARVKNELFNQQIFPDTMLADYAKVQEESSTFENIKIENIKPAIKEVAFNSKAPIRQDTNPSAQNAEVVVNEENPEYAIENPIHEKNKNIFEVISHRYIEVFHRD
jgi:hypothetical protein